MPDLRKIKKLADEADRQLPTLASELAEQGKTLIIDADNVPFPGDRVFCEIPTGKYIIATASPSGMILFDIISKKNKLPLFLEIGDFTDVSEKHYNEQEKALVNKR